MLAVFTYEFLLERGWALGLTATGKIEASRKEREGSPRHQEEL